ncbi:MAG TPA: sulfurtransferase TusA family protein [Bacillota bacterium]|jgi:tRNA 2-thiouridine synthesizing protein A|nr:preprotein translocase subunit TatB [Clostridiales bacterium UBA9856]HQC81769.1 sulfurtransferase TusA family protein [Bacillota bacterium]
MSIDARGRACPEPVLMTKKALSANPEGVEILVDNVTAMENIKRFATNQGYQVTVEEQGEDYLLKITK